MSEIADLTHNATAFSQIMQMIWKRLNDSGKNWRHVYKALLLLEYLIKNGSNKVVQQCKEALASIKTLEDFQHLNNGTDQGINIRAKAKSLVALLKDDERLENERVRALKAKERIFQSTAGVTSFLKESGNSLSDTDDNRLHGNHYEATLPLSPTDSGNTQAGFVKYKYTEDSEINFTEISLSTIGTELASARPLTAVEEEQQLQLALSKSLEEAEQEESKTKADDIWLRVALEKSKQAMAEEEQKAKPVRQNDFENATEQKPLPPRATGASNDPQHITSAPALTRKVYQNDPWTPVDTAFKVSITSSVVEMTPDTENIDPLIQSFLGEEHSKLVQNLDNLASPGGSGVSSLRNPFEHQELPNPFPAKPRKPTLNELMQQNATWAAGQQDTQDKIFDPFL